MDIMTQLGGPYRLANHALFEVKKKLVNAGIEVRQPINDSFVVDEHNKAYGYDPQLMLRKEIELDHLRSIRTCDLHIVCNELGDNKGYIGDYTAQGMLYALLKRKPIVLLHKPVYDEKVHKKTVKILSKHEKSFYIVNVQKISTNKLQKTIHDIARSTADYQLTPSELEYMKDQTQKQLSQII